MIQFISLVAWLLGKIGGFLNHPWVLGFFIHIMKNMTKAVLTKGLDYAGKRILGKDVTPPYDYLEPIIGHLEELQTEWKHEGKSDLEISIRSLLWTVYYIQAFLIKTRDLLCPPGSSASEKEPRES